MKNDIGSFSSVLMFAPRFRRYFSLLIARIEGRPQLFLCICPAWVKNGSRETLGLYRDRPEAKKAASQGNSGGQFR
jgi:hypothetical protein